MVPVEYSVESLNSVAWIRLQHGSPPGVHCGGIVIESTAASMVVDYNKQACDGDPLLIATIGDMQISYGMIARSHLTLG